MPGTTIFKPAGVPLRQLTEVTLALDELEALRLADVEGLYQDDAGLRMGVSRATFGRILENARRKVAGALIDGQALRIAGGPVQLAPADQCPPDAGRRCCRRGRRGLSPANHPAPADGASKESEE